MKRVNWFEAIDAHVEGRQVYGVSMDHQQKFPFDQAWSFERNCQEIHRRNPDLMEFYYAVDD